MLSTLTPRGVNCVFVYSERTRAKTNNTRRFPPILFFGVCLAPRKDNAMNVAARLGKTIFRRARVYFVRFRRVLWRIIRKPFTKARIRPSPIALQEPRSSRRLSRPSSLDRRRIDFNVVVVVVRRTNRRRVQLGVDVVRPIV